MSNPDFSNGNSGFNSSYTYRLTGPAINQSYYITGNPQVMNPLWPAIGDHTTGSGNMFVVDASTNPNAACWCQNIAVQQHTWYKLSAWATLLYLPQSKLQFRINGVQLGNLFTLSSSIGSWTKYEGEWYSGSATNANICIYENTGVPYGNDFALDDIAFQEICIASDSTYIKIDSSTVNITATDSLCALDTLFLVANSTPPASSYSWKSPLSTANTQQWIIPNMQSVQSGWYVVTATSVNGCSSKDSVKIHVSEIPLELGDSFLLCNLTNRLTLNIPGASYLWQDSSTGNEYHITQSGTYYVTVNLNGCTKSDTVSGKIIAIGVSLGNDTSLCPGAIHQLSLADTFNAYNWNNGSTAPGINISEAGTYSVLVTKDKCTAADTVKVTYLDPWFDLGNDTILCNGERILLNPQSLPGSVYSWNNGTTGQVKEVTGAGLYIVAVENVCGTFSDTINIGFEECNCRPYIASAFSPNNDGHNDKISPRIFCPAGNYKFVIANRWGNIMFNTTNPLEKWDGTYKGTQADIGTYFYYYKITGPDGKEYSGKGDILLIR